MWKILLQEFYGDLKTQKLRAFLTVFSITWGTIAIVLLLSFGEGLRTSVVNGLLNAYDRMFMIYGGETSRIYEGLPSGRRIRLTEQDGELLRRTIPGVELVSPSYGRGGTRLRAGDVSTTTYMEGGYPSFELMRRMFPVAGGRFLNERDLEERRRVVFLGDSIAKRLFGDTPPVGQTVLIDDLPFTVVGVMQRKLQSSMNNGPDADRAIIPASTFRAIYGPRYVNHLLVRPRDVQSAEQVKAEIYRVLGRRYRFDPADERALSIWDLIEEEKLTRRIMLGIQIFLGVVGGLTLVVAGVGVANIMYVAVRERTREIGVKRALGARRRHIVAQFVFEALLLALTGGLAGLAVAAAVVLVVDGLPASNEAMEYLANPKLSWPVALGTVLTLTAIGLAAGVFPARRAAAVDPVESLRYE
ncbi:MAG TPA: ABC transporter permease [Longimicrobiales bacterium]